MQPGAEPRPFRERLRYDPQFHLELQFCVDTGIPHSTFLDWEPADRAKVVAYLLEKNSRCVMCGTADWEWQENRFAYEAIERHCPGCFAKAALSEGPAKPGVTVELAPTGTQASARRMVERQRRAKRRS